MMTVDAISLGVFRALFEGAAEEMGVTLQRAAFSPNIRERLDFSCAVFDHQARMIAQAAHIPVHLGSMPASVEAAIRASAPFSPGDVIVLNDPYAGGTHLPDITMVSPVFVEGEPRFFAASRAHHADVGGMSPGSLPLSTELYQEGIILPPVRLYRAGELQRDLLALITANSRAPQERQGDLEAQLAAQRIGEARLKAIAATHGLERTEAHAAALMAYAQRITEAAIRAIPDGVYGFEDTLEGDGQSEQPIRIHAEVTVSGGAMTIDFRHSDAQAAGNLNAVTAIARSAAWYAVRLLIGEDLPVNHGCFAPVTVITRPGSILDPHFPAAVAVGNTETSQRIVDVVLGALSLALPDRIPSASQGTMNNVTIGGIHNSKQFVYYETIAGGHGASAEGIGLSGRHSHMTNTRNTPVEALELALPMRVTRYHLRNDSGGAGNHNGGDGIVREYEFLTAATVTINSERRIRPPYGLNSGAAGMCGVNELIRGGEITPLPGKWTGTIKAGDRLRISTPGGGGWGASTSDTSA